MVGVPRLMASTFVAIWRKIILNIKLLGPQSHKISSKRNLSWTSRACGTRFVVMETNVCEQINCQNGEPEHNVCRFEQGLVEYND